MPPRSRSSADSSDAFKVAIRVRPLIARERKSGAQMFWSCDTKQIFQLGPDGRQTGPGHFFDRVFDHEETTQDVYDEIAQPIIESVMEGYNGTIFAYGQTSSGKTYTMMGDGRTEGIIPYAIDDMFHFIDQHPDREYLFRVSFMEIYNETVSDLLAVKDAKPGGLQIREHLEGGVYVANLEEKLVRSKDEVLEWMKKGEKRRHVAGTNMNERSSRSHTIFRVIIESREQGAKDDAVNVSQLNLVDLAGSERASQTGAEGQRLKESGAINQSLLTLSNVIRKLSECPPEGAYIAYRDSKLTRILQMSLGGNSKTAVICAVTPAEEEQTKSTLQFATTSKSIKNKPVVNEVLSEMAMLNRAKKEIANLQKKIQEMNSQTGFLTLEQDNEELRQKLQEQEQLQQEQEKKLKNMELFMCRSSIDTKALTEKAKKNPRRATWCPRVGQQSRLSFDPSSFKPPNQDVNLSLCDVPEFSIPRKRRKHFSGEPIFGDLDPVLESPSGESFSLEGGSGDSLPDFDMLEESRSSVSSTRSSRSSRRVAFLPTLDELPKLMFIEAGTQTEDAKEDSATKQDDIPDAANAPSEKEQSLQQELQFKKDQCLMLECQLSSLKEKFDAVEERKDKIIQELEAKMATHQEVVHQLNEVIDETVEEKQCKEEELVTLRAKVSRLELRLNTAAGGNNNEELQNTISSLEQQLATVQKDRDTEVNALRTNINMLEKQLEGLRQRDGTEILGLHDQIADLEGQLAASHHQDSSDEVFTEEQTNAAEELALKNREIAALQQQLSDLEKRRRAYSTSDADVIELRKTLDEAFFQCELLLAEKTTLETAINELQDNNSKLNEDFQHIVVQKDQLQEQLKTKEEELNELEEFTRLEREMHEEEKRAQQTDTTENKPSEDELAGLRKTAADAEALTVETNKKLTAVSAEKEELVSRLAGLEKKLEELEREKADADSYLHLEKEQHQRMVTDLREQLQKSYDESAQLRLLVEGDTTVDLSAQQQSTDRINALQQNVQELQAALQAMTAERDEVRLDLGESVEQVMDSQEELYKLQQSYSELQTRHDQQSQELQNIQAQGEHTEAGAGSTQEKAQRLEADLQATAARLAEAEEALQQSTARVAELERLAQDTAAKEEELIQLREDLATSQGSVDRLLEQLSALEQKEAENSHEDDSTHLREELAAKDTQIEQMSEQLKTSEQKSAEDSLQVSALKEKLSNTESALAEARKQAEDLEEISIAKEDLSKHPKDVQLLQEQLHQARMAHAELQKRYERLEHDLSCADDFKLAEANKDIFQQQKITQLEMARRESMAVSSKTMEDNRKEIDSLTKQICDLQAKLQHQTLECQQAVHEREKAAAKLEDYKVQVRDLENLHTSHAANTNRHQNMDPDKMVKIIKQLELNLDLTKQKVQKLERDNKKLQELEDTCDRLQFAKSQLQGEVERSKMAFETEREQNSIQQRRNNNSNAEVAEMRRQVEKFAEEAKTASGMLAAKEEEIKAVQQELQAARNKLQQDSGSSQEQHRIISELKQQLQSAESDVETIKGQLGVAEENFRSSQEKLSETEQKLDQTSRDLQEAGQQIEKLRKDSRQLQDRCCELEEVGNSAAAAADQRATDLQDRLSTLETERDSLLDDLRTVSGQKGQLQKDMEKLQEDHSRQVNSICDQLTAVEEEKNSLRQQLSQQGQTGQALANLQIKLDQAHDNLKLETAKVGGLHIELSKSKETLAEMEAQVCGLRADLTDKDSQVAAAEGAAQQLHTQLLQVRTDTATLHTQLEEARSHSEDLSARLTETQADLRDLQDKYNNSRLEVNDLQDVTNEFKEENAALASQVSQLETDLEQTRERVFYLEDRLKEAVSQQTDDSELQTLMTRLTNLQEEGQQERKNFEEQTRNLSDQLDKKKAEVQEVKKELDDFQEFHSREYDRMEKCCDEADAELAEAKQELKQYKEAAASQQTTRKHQDEEVETLKAKMTALEKQAEKSLKDLQDQLDKKKAEVQEVKKELDDFQEFHIREYDRMEKCCDEADAELAEAKQELKQYKEAAASQQTTRKHQDEEVETLKAKITTLEKQAEKSLKDLQDQLDKKKAEVQEVKKELDDFQEFHSREYDRMEKCCDEADAELAEARQELKQLKEAKAQQSSLQEAQGHRTRLAALQQSTVQEKETLQQENKALQSELATFKMQVAGLQHDMKIAVDPYKKRCRVLDEDNLKLRQDVRERENEIRRLRQNMDESFQQPKEPALYSSGSGIVNSTAVYILEAEKSRLNAKVKQLTTQVQKLTAALDNSRSEGTDMRRQVEEAVREKKRLEEHISHLRHRHTSEQNQKEQTSALPAPVARTMLEGLQNSPSKTISPRLPLSPARVGTVSQASGAAGIAQRAQTGENWMELFDYGDDDKDLQKDNPNCKVS